MKEQMKQYFLKVFNVSSIFHSSMFASQHTSIRWTSSSQTFTSMSGIIVGKTASNLFLESGRSAGNWWWRHIHPPLNPKGKNGMVSSRVNVNDERS